MAKTLLVVDSPRKAKTLARWLARDVRLVTCSGPARALPRRRMGVDVKQGFALEYEVPTARQKEVRALVAAASSAAEVWLAAPPGAAGEAFCALAAGTLSQPREAVRRLELSEVTEEGLDAAIRGRRPIDEGPAKGEEAREVLDRLAGPALARCLGEERVRAGGLRRVDALALALLCEQEADPDSRRRPSKEAGLPFRVARGPASPLTVMGLLEACFERHGLSARQALRLAERLHEGVDLPGGLLGLITSPRSAGSVPSQAAVIRPTSRGPEPSSIEEHLSRVESWLYALVWDGVTRPGHDRDEAVAEKPSRRSEGPWTEPDLIRELVDNRAGPTGSCVTVAASLEQAGLVEGGPAALRPTLAGRRAATRLREGFPDLASAPAAATLEGQVAALVRGEENRLGLYGTFWKRIQQDLGRVPWRREDPGEGRRPEGPPCDRCGAPTLERSGPYGPFRACSNYPSCTSTRSLDGVPRAAEVGVLCPRCSNAPVVERMGPTGRIFYGCRAYPKCRFTTHHRPVAEPCPRCGQAYLLEKSTREGLVHVCGGCRYRVRVATPPSATPRPG